MSFETTTGASSEQEHQPRLEFASNLLDVLRDAESRDFSLDIQQDEALVAVGQALIDGTPSGYVEMATSTGKTAVEALIAEAAVKTGHRVLMLAPKIGIAKQITGDDETRPTGLRKFADLPQAAKVMSHYDGEKATKDSSIVVSTYAGFLNDVKNNHAQLGEFDVIIADECHRSLGAETSKALKTAFPSAFKLGLSATPDFASDRKSDEVYDRKLYDFSLMRAIESGRTAPLRALVYETHETVIADQSFGDFTERELAPLIENLQRNGTALQMAESLVAEGRQGLIACIPGSNNIHARRMAQLLQQRGISSLDIGSHLTPDEQHARLKQFQAGGIDVLTFTRTLEEGWDSDRASFAINMAPTTSPVRTKQLIGRVLRKKADGSESIYIDFIDQTRGATKGQYTALHALDLEYVDYERTLGTYSAPTTGGKELPEPILRSLNPRLVELLAQSQGKRIADITVPPKLNGEILKWERILRDDFKKDGESAYLSPHPVFDEGFAKKYQKAFDRFVSENGVEPTIDELKDELGKLTTEQQELLGSYAFQLPLEEVMAEAVERPDDSMENHLERAEFEMVRRAMILSGISRDEYGVLLITSGLMDVSPFVRSYHTAGVIIGGGFDSRLTGQEARRIEQEAAQKIREYLGISLSMTERSLGEHLNLYANFDAYHPETSEQAHTAYALLALESYADGVKSRRLGGRQSTETVRRAFDLDKIFLPGEDNEQVTVNLPELILPVAEELHEQAKQNKNKEMEKILSSAIDHLHKLAARPEPEEYSATLDVISTGHFQKSATPTNEIRYGFLK
jgi:superfamily II DNA or RNA helicase